MSKVDIVIPVFNGASYIQEAVQSALNQTYEDKEVLVVDDGSVDSTRDILSKFSGRIKYIYQTHAGVASARNKGIKVGNGSFVAFLDADDVWYPEKLEKQISALENNQQAGFVYCDNYFVNEKRKIIDDKGYKVLLKRGNVLFDLFMNYFIITSSLVVRRACFEWIGYFKESLKVGEDYDFFLRLTSAFSAEVVEEKLWERRVLENSLSHQNFILDWQTDINTLNTFLKHNKSFFGRYRPYIKKRLSQFHFDLAYHSRKTKKYILSLKNSFLSLHYDYSLKAFKNLLYSLFHIWENF